MDNNNIELAFEMCRTLIGSSKATASDEEIDQAINDVCLLPKLSSVDKTELKKMILNIYGVSIEDYQIITGREKRAAWLNNYRANHPDAKWSFWKRYKMYLEKDKNLPPMVISKLDELTDTILDHLFDPNRENIKIDKKGMVVGQVQSGKTGNYIGLICKAADAGFNFIIVLTGIHNSLRSQTQTRLDEGFLGFDTQFARAYQRYATTNIGVGKFGGFEDAIANSYTTSLDKGDFTQKGANAAGFNFNNPQPLLLVLKKNSTVLENLWQWLNSQKGEKDYITNKALLLIDDEADNASINTNAEGENPTTINNWIREIRKLFNRKAYVAYTATPFANIFIEQNLEDIFPSDFIINLPAPSNYIGPEKIFGINADAPEDEKDQLPIVVPISDYELYIPEGHAKSDPIPSIELFPKSLRTAIKSFILTCAIRQVRGQIDVHNSMLIHLSRFTNWQSEIASDVTEILNYYRSEIAANDKSVIEELRQLYEEGDEFQPSFLSVTESILSSDILEDKTGIEAHPWADVKKFLYNASQGIFVKEVNGTSKDILDYQDNPSGIYAIVIGGDKLSRGLTLEGLSISYFLRASKMYDTLMQMGRWFGYRPKYIDLCRLYTSSEINTWFRHIAMASAELREEFDYLAKSGGTPENFRLKVRTHPGRLQITAANKMRKSDTIQVSWSGKLIETYQLSREEYARKTNLVATKNLIHNLGKPTKSSAGGYLWTKVQPSTITEFLGDFILPSSLRMVNLELIVKFIEEMNDAGELDSWSVYFSSKQALSPNPRHFDFGNSIIVNTVTRTRAEDTLDNTFYIKNNHIVKSLDELVDIDENTLKVALEKLKEKKPDWKQPYPSPSFVRREYRDKHNPILMIYAINAEDSNVLKDGSPVAGFKQYTSKDDPFIGFAIAFPESNSGRAVAYTTNLAPEFEASEENYESEYGTN